jgi:hypothetical protein
MALLPGLGQMITSPNQIRFHRTGCNDADQYANAKC